MAVADALVTQLTGAERQVLDSWTAKFASSWHAERLAQVLQSPPEELKPHPQIYLTELVKIDLRQHWQSGQLRRVEGYLVEYPKLGTLETVSVELLYAEYLARKTTGRSGAFEDLSERFPRKAASLRELIGRVDGEADWAPPAAVAPQPVASPPEKAKDEDVLKFGRFQVEKEIGSDDTGTTYEARDSIYDRRALVKVLRFEGRAAAERTERFLRDARAAAKLQHEHIGEVYEAGRHDGAPFIVTAIHPGRPLANFINAEHPFTASKAAIIARQLALALHDAHSIGAVHGDINPINITVDRNRKPVLVNFGLVGRIDTGDERDIFGTAAYVAPELVTSSTSPNPATDQYSLGIVLFEMLTGRLPMEGSDKSILAKKQSEEAPPPSSLRPEIDPKMDDIVARMTSRYVEDRFADMQKVAEAMQSLLTDGEVPQPDKGAVAQPETTAAASKTDAGPAAASSASATSSLDVDAAYAAEQQERVAAFIRNGNYDAAHELLLEMSKQTKPALRESVSWARGQLKTLKEQHQDAVEQVRILVTTADEFIARHDYDQALQLLEGVPPGLATTGVKQLRKEARQKLERIDEVGEDLDAARGRGHTEEVQRLAWELESLRPTDPRLRQLRQERKLRKERRQEAPKMSGAGAAGLVAGILLVMVLVIVGIFLLRGPTTGQVSVRVNDQRLEVFIDGEPITLTGDGWEQEMEPEAHTISVRIGDRDLKIGTPTEVKHEDGTIDKHDLTIAMNGVALSDGGFVVSRGVPVLLQIDYKLTTTEPKKPDPPPQVAGNDGEKKKPDPDPKPKPKPKPKKEPPTEVAPRFTQLLVLRGHTRQVRSVTFSSDGSQLATSSYDETGALWDTSTGRRIRQFRGRTRKLFAADLSSDGKYYAGATEANVGLIWDAKTGRVVSTCRGHTADLFTVRFSPDGKTIATAGHDRRLFLRRVPGTEKLLEIKAHDLMINDIAFSTDGSRFATASSDKTAKIWNTKTGELIRTFRGHTRGLRTVAFSPDGKTLVTSSPDQLANVYDTETGKLKFSLIGHTHQLWVAAISPDGRFVATAGNDMNVIIWSLKTGKQLAKFKAHTDTIHCAAFSSNGRLFATGSSDNTAVVWRVDPQ